jgi:hypothetical protein
MMSVDNSTAKKACDKNGVKGVPVLLIEYFFIETSNVGKKQMLEKEQIYQWVDEVVKTFGAAAKGGTAKNLITSSNIKNSDKFDARSAISDTCDIKTSKGVTFLNSSNNSEFLPSFTFDETPSASFTLLKSGKQSADTIENNNKSKPSTKNMSAAAIAAEIEQQRKAEDEKFTSSMKSNKFGDSHR